MSWTFRPESGLIFAVAEISGPKGRIAAKLILDTGASSSTLNINVLRSAGYEPDASTDFARLVTGSGVDIVPRLVVTRLSALGRHTIGLRVSAHDLPQASTADGLLGLDFFRGLALTIDFRAGQIDLA